MDRLSLIDKASVISYEAHFFIIPFTSGLGEWSALEQAVALEVASRVYLLANANGKSYRREQHTVKIIWWSVP